MNVRIQIVALLSFYVILGVSGAPIEGSFKCGELECPNGAYCEIQQKPSGDFKSVTIETQCRNAAGDILQETTSTKEVPEGKIPFTSIKRKTVNSEIWSGFCGGAGVHTDRELEPTIDFVPLGSDQSDSEHPDSENEFLPFDFVPEIDESYTLNRFLNRDLIKDIFQLSHNIFDNVFANIDDSFLDVEAE